MEETNKKRWKDRRMNGRKDGETEGRKRRREGKKEEGVEVVKE